ncbi:hypothetical protein IKF21_03185 [Candidatus Saccharibacteria bacterium]|nr:hypothetical protein [Candidatus Saccharibacteria bacterium]
MEQNSDNGVPVAPMVENKQKSGNGLKIAAAIACIVAVCGIGFGIYGMIQSSQKDTQISDLKVEINDRSTKIEELETEVSDLNNKIEEVAIDTETITTTDTDVIGQVTGNDNSETAAILLGAILDKNDSRTVFKVGDCTADGPSVKCPATVDGKNALISYNSNDSMLRLSLPND